MPPKTRTRVIGVGVYEASNIESNQAPSPPLRRRGCGRGKGCRRPAKQAEEPALKEESVNWIVEMWGVHQTLNTLVELLDE